jgi:hypothetical protein
VVFLRKLAAGRSKQALQEQQQDDHRDLQMRVFGHG